jgi:hypothetical protein
MSLLEIKRYLMRVRVATLTQLCHIFNASPQTMRCLLEHLVLSGKVRQCKKRPACGTKCAQCPTDATLMYEWLDPPSVPTT